MEEQKKKEWKRRSWKSEYVKERENGWERTGKAMMFNAMTKFILFVQ